MFDLSPVLVCICIVHFLSFTISQAAQERDLTSVHYVQDSPEALTRRALPQISSTFTAGRAVFRIPRSDLILTLYPQGGATEEGVKAVLLTADSWIARKISIFGPDAPTDFIFQYGTGDRPYTRLIVWNLGDEYMTWGRLKTMVDGLWVFLVDRNSYEYCYWEIYERQINKASLIGHGAIVTTNEPPTLPRLGSNHSTLRRALPFSSLLISSPPNRSDLISTTFSLPRSGLTFDIRETGHRLRKHDLNALLLVAAVQLDDAIKNFGEHTASGGAEYAFGLDQDVQIWFLKVLRSSQGYLTNGQLREMIAGLQVYMVLEDRPNSIRFRLLYGQRKTVLGHGAVGNLWPPDSSSNLTGTAES